MTASIIPVCFSIFWIFSAVIGIAIAALVLMIVAHVVGIENAEYQNCLVAVFIGMIINLVVSFIFPIRFIMSLPSIIGFIISMSINAWIIANVLQTSMMKAFAAAFILMAISYVTIMVF